MVNKSAIEQTAYIRASAEKKKLDLSKFEQDIRRELNSPSASTSSNYDEYLYMIIFSPATSRSQYQFR